MKVNKKKCIMLVIDIMSDMLQENKEYTEYIGERFIDWCENGDTFAILQDDKKITKQEKKQCIKYMKELAPLIDTVTDKLLYIYNQIDEENEKATI